MYVRSMGGQHMHKRPHVHAETHKDTRALTGKMDCIESEKINSSYKNNCHYTKQFLLFSFFLFFPPQEDQKIRKD